jgi:hypothetical protein
LNFGEGEVARRQGGGRRPSHLNLEELEGRLVPSTLDLTSAGAMG